MNKGFVLSFSTILILLVLVWFAIFYSGKVARSEENIFAAFAVEKAGFVADDLITDLNRLLGTTVDVNRGTSFTTIEFRDALPADVNKLQLIDYNAFVDANYSIRQGASIALGLDSLVDGNTEMVFSNGLSYDYNYGVVNSILFHNPGGDSGAITYDINVTINDSSVWVAPWAWQDVTGDINVNLYFSDDNAANAVTYSGKLDSSIENTYRWDYSGTSGDSFYIKVGSISGSSNAVQLVESISDASSVARTYLKSTIASPIDELKWYYDADLNYSQADVNVNRKFELGRA